MKALHKRRLLKLATFLREKVPDEHFDLGVWVDASYDVEAIKELPKVAAGKQRGCSTVACAIGWCPAVFPKAWQWHRRFLDDVGLIGGRSMNTGFQFAAEFFGIDERNCVYLFLQHDGYKSRRNVVKRIKSFVARGGMPKSRYKL